MSKPGTIRKVLLAIAMVSGTFLIATLVVDVYALRAEVEAVEQGRISEAAELAGRVHLLRPILRRRLRQQIPRVAESDRRFPREEPLITALLALGDDALMEARRASLRALAAGPERLELADAKVILGDPRDPPAGPGPEPLPTGTLLLADAIPASGRLRPGQVDPGGPRMAGPLGTLYSLTRRSAAGAVVPLGEGEAGPMGRSWDLTADGHLAVVARPVESLIERWDLAESRFTLITAPSGPRLVALGPTGKALAFAGPREAGTHAPRAEQLWVKQPGAASVAVYPPAGERVGAMAFAWSPDGRSLLVRATAQAQASPGDPLHLTWVAADGRVLARALVEAAKPVTPPRWVPGPGGRLGLVLAGDAWVWDGKADAARPLTGVEGEWGFSPDGRLIAGVVGSRVFVVMVEAPQRRVDRVVGELPLFFALEPGGFAWDADGLRFTGRGAASAEGPWQAVHIAVRLKVQPE